MSNTHYRRRHATQGTGAGGAATRETHGAGYSPVPTDPYYGGVIDYEAIRMEDMTDGIVDGETHIKAQSIDKPLFAESIRPPTVVQVLPVLPHADYPEGSLVFLTTDGKLYRNVADAWSVEVATVDLSGTIETLQIADSAITSAKLLDGSVISQKIADLTVSPTVAGSPLVTDQYVQARGMNLVTNGFGLLGSNYNFSQFTFDPAEVFAGGGSFESGPYAIHTSDEDMPVDLDKMYLLTVWAKQQDPTKRAYIGIQERDIDGFSIVPYYHTVLGGSTKTYLAADLNPGDTTVQLVDGTGWATAASGAHLRWLRVSGYTNSKGYTYPDHQYSLRVRQFADVVGNTLTLNEPWPSSWLPVPAGTAVANGFSGASYKYIAASNAAIPTDWTRYRGKIGGINTAQDNNQNQFSYGTAFVRLLFLPNYPDTAATNKQWYSAISFTEIAAENLLPESITETLIAPGSITTPKIAANAVTANEIAAGAVTADEISAGAVTTGKLAAGAVTANEIAAEAVTTGKLAALAVTAAQIAAGAIETDKLAANSVVAGKIAALAVETDKLAANAVTAEKIAADTITAGQIAASAIGADEIAANAVTAAKIAAKSIHAGHVGDVHVVAAPNGGFEFDGVGVAEGGAISGWIASPAASLSTLNHSGKYSLKLRNRSGGTVEAFTSEWQAVKGGRRLRSRAWMRGLSTNSATATGQLIVQTRNAAGSISAFGSSITIGTNGVWQEKVFDHLLAADVVEVRSQLRHTTASATDDNVFFDDVELFYADTDTVHGEGSVVIDSTGITVTNGKITVQNGSGTVIIDGSSEMFLIKQQGTLSRSATAGTEATAFTDVSAVAAECPAFLGFLSLDAPTALPRTRWSGTFLGTSIFPRYTATTSGGTVNSKVAVPNVIARFVSFFDDPIASIDLVISNHSPSTYTAYGRYYILQKAAI